MGKLVKLVIICLFVLSIAAPSYAHTGSTERLKDSFFEFVKSPSGFFTLTAEEVHNSEDNVTGFFVGLIRGTDYFINHAVGGFVGMVTSPISNDK